MLISLLTASGITMCLCVCRAGREACCDSKQQGCQEGEVDGVVIELPEDTDPETKDFWQQHREIEKKMQQLQGEMGVQGAKRRKVKLASPEAAAKTAAELQAAAATAEEAGGPPGL